MIGLIVYGLCVVTSALCAVLLLRGYARSRVPLLLWSGLCFIGLTLNNVLLFIDVRCRHSICRPGAPSRPWPACCCCSTG